MKGGMGKRQRQDAQNALLTLPKDAEKAILATGRYLGEGFDEPRLDTLFLTLPISWKGTLSQYAGRLHRVHDMKIEVVIYDYADLDVPMLEKMYERRLSGYRAIGYEIRI
jgi:superfamily II DNA or RNA helicase